MIVLSGGETLINQSQIISTDYLNKNLGITITGFSSTGAKIGLLFLITNKGKEKFVEKLINNEEFNIIQKYQLGDGEYNFPSVLIEELKNSFYEGNYNFLVTKDSYNKLKLELVLQKTTEINKSFKEIGFFIDDTLFIYGYNVNGEDIIIDDDIITKLEIYFEI